MRRLIPTLAILLASFAILNGASWADDSPAGSYQTTCQSVKVTGTSLHATCKNIDGRWAPASLADFNQCIGDIHNYNGQLHCNMGSTPPRGPYTETCRFIFASGTTLTANCKNAGGKWVAQTYLANFNQCIGDIHNYNGQLHCNIGSTPPPGPYSQTCRFIFTIGSRLTANCKDALGEWAAQTSLSNFDRCTGDIVNVNGLLRCSVTEAPRNASPIISRTPAT
jgi:hypothetical protein